MFFKNKRKKQLKEDLKERSTDLRPNQKVISYYTASKRQLDKFERNSVYNVKDATNKGFLSHLRHSWFFVLAIIILIIAGIYLSLLGENPRLTISGPIYRSKEDYQKIVKDILSDNMRNRFKPLLMSKDIEDKILQSIPEAESVSVKSTFLGHDPEIKIYTSNYLAYFNQTGGQSLIISNSGRLLLPLSDTDYIDNNDTPILENATGVIGEAGEQFMSPNEANTFDKLNNQYKKSENIKPSYVLSEIPHELTVQEPGRGYVVKYLLEDDILQQFGALRAAEKRLQQTGQTPLEYIDVRIANKVFYK
jgi:hypothetical protein